jgi:hypothetical protein
MTKTTIVLSRKTHAVLQALGRKGESFDELVMELVKQRVLNTPNASEPTKEAIRE